jgi:hypothetical protein
VPDDGIIISGGKEIIKNICANYVEGFYLQGISFASWVEKKELAIQRFLS